MGVDPTAECERARSRVSLALDAELSEIEHVSLRTHLERCAACACYERDLDALTRTLRTAPLVPMRATPGIGRRPDVEVLRPRRRSAAVRVLRISAAVAAVALAAGLGSLAGSVSSPGTATAITASGGGVDLAAMRGRGIFAMPSDESLSASRVPPLVAL
jgi:predicted anti-sigma-YlaC factor YlaD